jgi:hypothetical protein
MNLKSLIAALMLGVLASCVSNGSEETSFGIATSGLFGGQQEEFPPRFIELLKAEKPALQVSFLERKVTSFLLLEQRKGAFDWWLSSDSIHLIMQNGMLHGTRGLGEGFLAADLSEPLKLVTGLSSGWSDRFHTYLNGADFAVSRTYRCLIENDGAREIKIGDKTVQTRLMKESCRSLDQSFINLYWVNLESRDIVQSRQWVGPVVGIISTRAVPN